ncbi:MAG: hypothetical protein OEU32_08655 [Acidimicrobiia bacterium]|nr:hypothetical protein [Acidimicrobiia bacterium]
MQRSLATALLVLMLAACGSDGDDEATADSAGPPATAEPTPDAGAEPEAEPRPDAGPEPEADQPEELFPDVLDAGAMRSDDGTWSFDVTISSPYDTPARYADAWRVLGPDGAELGVRVLTHDHAGEQPFTRSLSGVEIPDGVTVVTIQGRDQVSGWGGATVDVTLVP